MTSDMHIHSKYSPDSKSKLYDIVSFAEENNINYIGIVDHVNFKNQPVNEIVHRIKSRNRKIDEISNDTKVKILKGLEVSEPHKYKEEMKYIYDINDTDYILGAIHNVLGIPLNKLTKHEDLEKLYIDNLYNIVNESNIDAVAHIDLIKKYININDTLFYKGIEDVLKTMIKRNILLEINSNGYDIVNEYFPSSDIISLYKLYGGRNIILGSDAHKIDDIYRYLDLFYDNKLDQCYIEKRKIKKIQ